MSREPLAEELARVPGLVAAYLFGSRARGNGRPDSDADVAVLLTGTPTTYEECPLELAGDLERAVGCPVDVVVLNGADPDLIHRVLRDGVLLLERDRAARVRFEVRARGEYFDMLPVRNAYRRRILQHP